MSITHGSIVIKNIYYMLAYAYKSMSLDDYARVEGEEFDHLHDLMASILIRGLSMQLHRGVDQAYVVDLDSGYRLQGRILPYETLLPQNRSVGKATFTFDELTTNTYMNRVIKTTIAVLLHSGELSESNGLMLRMLSKKLGNLRPLDRKDIRWSGMTFHRGNRGYQLLMAVCNLILNGMILSEDKGSLLVQSFMSKEAMHSLYQRFLLEYYRRNYSSSITVNADKIPWAIDGEPPLYLPEMQSDITLTSGDRKLVIDAKCYGKVLHEHWDKERYLSGHLYQIGSYVSNLDFKHEGNVDGMLLYAMTDEGDRPNASWKTTDGNRMSVETLNLNDDFSQICSQLDGFVAYLAQ